MDTDIRRGEHRTFERVHFEPYAREWADTYTGRTTTGLRESTRECYRWSVENAIDFFGKRLAPLSEVEPRDVRAYVALLCIR